MNTEINSALYYPRIEFDDPRWLWTAALVWDKVYRIVPDDYTPEDSDNVKALCADGDIGIQIRPGLYAKEVADEFIANLHDKKWQAAALEKDRLEDYAKLHQGKIDVKIREMLISHGRAAAHEEWLYVPTDFEALYMTYLATKIAKRNNLQAVSDSDAAWTALTYYSMGDIETEGPEEEQPFALAALMIGDYMPANLTDIAPEKLLHFRQKFPDERRNFMKAIKSAAHQLANCHDATVASEMIREIGGNVHRATNEFKRCMDDLKVDSFRGFKTLSFPISTSVLGSLLPPDFMSTMILGATGVALGCIAGVASLKQKGKRLSRESDFSYLVHAEQAFPKTADGINVPRRLHYDLNEFIND
jgi:hypothetical protein